MKGRFGNQPRLHSSSLTLLCASPHNRGRLRPSLTLLCASCKIKGSGLLCIAHLYRTTKIWCNQSYNVNFRCHLLLSFKFIEKFRPQRHKIGLHASVFTASDFIWRLRYHYHSPNNALPLPPFYYYMLEHHMSYEWSELSRKARLSR